MKRLVEKRIELDGLDRLGRQRAVEEQQRDAGRGLREQGEVDAIGVHGRTHRVRRPGMCGEPGHATSSQVCFAAGLLRGRFAPREIR
jgi:hypothetical protein